MEIELVGRERERVEIKRRLMAASAGQGALVLIGGEAGAGKTLLAQWTLAEAEHTQTAVGRCVGPGETPMYGPWRDLVAQLPAFSWPTPLLEMTSEGQTARSSVHGRELATALAQAVRAAGRPFVLLLEDIQWADTASLDLLRHFAGHVAGLPLLLLATYRNSEVETLHTVLPDLSRAGSVRLTLDRFTADEVAAMTAQVLPGDPRIAVMARYLLMRTAGNPFFVSELLAMVHRGGAPDGKLPETVQHAIEQQLRTLEGFGLQVLYAAAVIGERFDYDLLLQVADGREEDVIAALEAALAVHVIRTDDSEGNRFAFDHALVREVVLSRVIAPRRRRWHLRVAEALLPAVDAGMSGTANLERLALHLERAGDSRAVKYLLLVGDRALQLGARSQAAERYEQVLTLLGSPAAQGATGGSYRSEALLRLAFAVEESAAQRYCAEALETAEALGDCVTAVWARYLDATWQADQGHPDALRSLKRVREEQELLLADARYQRLEQALFGETLAYPRVTGTLALALTKAGRAAEAETLLSEMQARTRPGDRRTPIIRVQWWMSSLMGRWEDAVGLGQRLIDALLVENDERAAFAVASNRLYHVLLCRAEDPPAVDAVMKQMLQLGERVSAVSGYDPLEDGHPPLGWYSYLRGDWEVARKHLLGYLEHHPHDADPGVRGFAVMLQLAQGDTAGARATLMAVPPLHPDEDPRLHMVQISAYLMRAELCLSEGDVVGAREWLEAASRYQRLRGGTAFRASARLTWARYYSAAGDDQVAFVEAKQALVEAGSPREIRALINANRLAGELAVRVGRAEDAPAYFEAAEELADRCAFPYEAAMTQLVMAEAVPGAGKDVAAAAATFARLGAAPAFARARAIIDVHDQRGTGEVTASQRLAWPAVRDPGLSAREMEVVHLVAQGLTDKEVAARLYISPRTVDGHLRRIFAKLGVSSRTALVALGARHGWI